MVTYTTLRILVGITLFLFILLGPIILLGNTQSTYLLFSSSEEMQEIISFLFSEGRLSSFDELESSHMEDVKFLLEVGKWFFVFSVLILFFYFYNVKDNLLLKRVGALGLGFGFVTIIIAIFNFGFAFKIFHEVLFPQGNWMFPYNSLIIQIFPQEIFFKLGIVCIVLSLAGFLFCYYQSTR